MIYILEKNNGPLYKLDATGQLFKDERVHNAIDADWQPSQEKLTIEQGDKLYGGAQEATAVEITGDEYTAFVGKAFTAATFAPVVEDEKEKQTQRPEAPKSSMFTKDNAQRAAKKARDFVASMVIPALAAQTVYQGNLPAILAQYASQAHPAIPAVVAAVTAFGAVQFAKTAATKAFGYVVSGALATYEYAKRDGCYTLSVTVAAGALSHLNGFPLKVSGSVAIAALIVQKAEAIYASPAAVKEWWNRKPEQAQDQAQVAQPKGKNGARKPADLLKNASSYLTMAAAPVLAGAATFAFNANASSLVSMLADKAPEFAAATIKTVAEHSMFGAGAAVVVGSVAFGLQHKVVGPMVSGRYNAKEGYAAVLRHWVESKLEDGKCANKLPTLETLYKSATFAGSAFLVANSVSENSSVKIGSALVTAVVAALPNIVDFAKAQYGSYQGANLIA